MHEIIDYEELGEIDDKTPLEAFFEAMRPQLGNYGLTAEFPADKPSLDYSTYGIEFRVSIGEPPAAIYYDKHQESPYANGGIDMLLESETLVHAATGDKLSLKIYLTDYLSGMTLVSGNRWLTIRFKGEKSEVEALQNAVAPVLAKYGFHSRKVKTSPVSGDSNEDGSVNSNANLKSNSMTTNVNLAGNAENTIDFDELSRKATVPNAPMDRLDALFGAVFELSEWHFISRGELPNVYPYVASNAQYADNQPMVRAFTDTKRLMRFAQENNLTGADGAAQILTIPTAKIVEYLEGFVAHGAYGVWFNSDSNSDGFFIPIKQLRPITAHLAKINRLQPSAPKTSVATLHFVIKEGLMLPSADIIPAPYTTNQFWRVPSDWVSEGEVKAEHLRTVEREMSGGRSDTIEGAFYVVTDYSTKVFETETVKSTGWRNMCSGDDICMFFIASANGEVRKVSAEEFQVDVDASFQTERTFEARAQQDNLANFGMSQTADGDFDQNLSLNQVGAVNFNASIAPFFETIVPLLGDFEGTGDFVSLLRFEPSGISELAENSIENSRGAYLQIRRFHYLNPKNNTRIGVGSIHSNLLRHVRSNAELVVSFELCKNLDNQTAALYYRFEGPKSVVLRLASAIEPLLANCGYEAVSA